MLGEKLVGMKVQQLEMLPIKAANKEDWDSFDAEDKWNSILNAQAILAIWLNKSDNVFLCKVKDKFKMRKELLNNEKSWFFVFMQNAFLW